MKKKLHKNSNKLYFLKDPRSEQQARQWEEDAKRGPINQDLMYSSTRSLVVDIIEARRIGTEVIAGHFHNYIIIKFDILDDKGKIKDPELNTQYQVEYDSRGWKYERWIDSFHMMIFTMPSTTMSEPYCYRVSMKFGTLDTNTWNNNYEELYANTSSKEIRINLAYKDPRYQSVTKTFSKLMPTWYQWRSTDKFIKISAQIVITELIPKFENFLPYTQWPPMILHTEKTRLDLMMEEEALNDDSETIFSGNLGTQLISYNPSTLPRILEVFSGDFNRDFMLAFGLVMGAPLIDRTGTLNVDKYDLSPDGSTLFEHKLKIKNLYPVPPIEVKHGIGEEEEKKSKNLKSKENDYDEEQKHHHACSKLSEILLARASEILKIAKNESKEIKILWSGGIDTTAMVTAFDVVIGNKTSIREYPRSNIKICYCESSKSEYPEFFDKTIGKFKTFQIPHHGSQSFTSLKADL